MSTGSIFPQHPLFSRNVIVTLLMLLALMALAIVIPESAFAQLPVVPDGTCTTDPDFEFQNSDPADGIVTMIISNVQYILDGVAQGLFNAVASNSGLQHAVYAAILMYVMIYGILFMTAMIQVTLWDFVVRMLKIAILAKFLDGSAWTFFSQTVVQAFNNGTNELIAVITYIATDGIFYEFDPSNASATPFAVLDGAIQYALSAKMAVTLMAVFATGPYGVLFGLLIVNSLGTFFKALVNAIWVYVMSLVLKTLLFGMAPIFIPCILFQRTRHLFDGWLNLIINASLQPILLFTFFAFFCVLIRQCLFNILARPVCWTEWSDTLRGSPFAAHFWRFTTADPDLGQWAPYSGIWDFTGGGSGEAFPMSFTLIVSLLILCELTSRFNTVVIEIAKDLAGAATDLRMSGESLAQWFRVPGHGEADPLGGAGGRMMPGSGGGRGGFLGEIGQALGIGGGDSPANPGTGSVGRPGTGGGVGGPGRPGGPNLPNRADNVGAARDRADPRGGRR